MITPNMELPPVTTPSTQSSTRRTSFFSSLTRRGQDQNDHEPVKGPIGLTTVYEPGSGADVVADIVFVHGLNGGSYSTWSKNNQRTHFWPKQWLSLDEAFRDVRVHTFGYPSALSRESILNISDFARSLLAAVSDSPVINQGAKTRLIFVAHSMGGLVVKKAFILGHQEPEFKPLIDRISAFFFLATPHQGAVIAQTLLRLMALVPGARPFVDDLLPQSTMLQSINEEFPKYCSNVQLLSFFESRPMVDLGVKSILIVEKTSAVMNLPNERKTFLDADHRGAAKYTSPKDPSYVAVRNALATVVSSNRSTSHSLAQAMVREHQAALNKFLTISDPPEDDILAQDEVRVPGSCEWVSSNECYTFWRESLGCQVLWLQGRLGAGKSVLAGHIVSDLRSKGADTCFFFFQSGDIAQSTVNGCLRSLAWQMAMLHSDVAAKIRQLMAELKDEPIDTIDSGPVWRKIFLSGILQVRLERPQFWVIDGMDECAGSRDMMNFLALIQEQWPVSVLVTCRDPVENHLSNTNLLMDIRSYTITEEDTKEDISMFVRSNVQHFPPVASSRWSSPLDMASQIVEDSGGCFLWASLVCSKLREVVSEREVEAVLKSTPSDMNPLYAKILIDMGNARFGKDLTKAVIKWTTYAFRPLTTVEVREPIEMELDDKFDDIERAISRCCGNMVSVDSHGKLRFVHSTAKQFLASENVDPEFAVSKAEGHRDLAMGCLQYLIKLSQRSSKSRRTGSASTVMSVRSSPANPNAPRPRKAASDRKARMNCHASSPGFSSSGSFTEYASVFLFRHLSQVPMMDDEILAMLSKFFDSTSVLCWIEFVATNEDLRTVYQAGNALNLLLGHQLKLAPSLDPAHGQKVFEMLGKWSDDLMHLVTKFSHRLKLSPSSIHHLIPPFCPAGSAIRLQFGNSHRSLSVQGVSASGWDDYLTTITYEKATKPQVVATGPGYFAVGMMRPHGKVMVYDDSVFQEIHALMHLEPVFCLTFAESGKFLASGGGKTVRIWSSAEGTELMHFTIPSHCLALSFADEDCMLRVATQQNQLIEWDLERHDFFQDEPGTWETDLDERTQLRVPTIASFWPGRDRLCVVYKGEDLILWDYAEDRIYDVYEKNSESSLIYDRHRPAGRATDVRAVSLSHSIDTNLLAATYTDGDLVVYDLDSGQPVATVESANAMVLASSYDGRTLAGVNSQGTLTLFEFKTLQPLSRIELGPGGLPKGLVFTSDSLRLVELSGNQCRVWGPTVLLRTDASDQESSDKGCISTAARDTGFELFSGTIITAMVSCKASNTVFCGLENGSVYAYDTSSEPQKHFLFVQTLRSPIRLLYVDETESILACGDSTGRVTARRVALGNLPQQTVWGVQDELLIDIGVDFQTSGLLKHVVVSGQQSRLLICTDKYDTLWPTSTGVEETWITQIEGSPSPHWLSHPTETELLVRVADNLTSFRVYRWSDLSLVRSTQVSLDGTLDRLVTLHHSRYFARISTLHSNPDTTTQSCVQIWDFEQLEKTETVMTPTSNLGSVRATILGSFGRRMVLYTPDYWVASVDLTPSSPSEDSFVRHFFVPCDWVGGIGPPILDVGRNGEILLAKGAELAVIRRGLEMTEDGASFNPRRARDSLLRPRISLSQQLGPAWRMASESRPSLTCR